MNLFLSEFIFSESIFSEFICSEFIFSEFIFSEIIFNELIFGEFILYEFIFTFLTQNLAIEWVVDDDVSHQNAHLFLPSFMLIEPTIGQNLATTH